MYKKYQNLGGLRSKRMLIDMVKQHFKNKIEIIKPPGGRKSSLIVPAMQKTETILSYMEVAGASTSFEANPLSFKGDSELTQLHKICSDIRLEIDKVSDYKENKNLDILNYRKYVPNSLFWLIGLLISDDVNTDDIITLNICQDIIYNRFKGRKLTPKHIGIGVMIHQETKSKKLVQSLHACGHCQICGK